MPALPAADPGGAEMKFTLAIATASLLALGVVLFFRAPLHPSGSRWHGLVAVAAALPGRHLLRSLRERRRDRLEIETIPGDVYLGRGFEWTPAHARLLLDRDGADLHSLGRPAERNLFLPPDLLAQHILILGTTGVGKTRMLELLVTQAIRRGDAAAVIDPKGDDGLLARVMEECARARRPFTLIAPPFPASSSTYNPLSNYADVREVADRVAALLPSGGDAEPFRNFGWELAGTVAAALARLGRPVSLAALRKYGIEDPWGLLREMNPGVKEIDKLAARGRALGFPEIDALIGVASRPRDHSMKMASSLLPILAKLTMGANRTLLSTDAFSWRDFDRGRGVAYFFLGSLLGADTASAVAKLALLDFQSHVGARYAYERNPAPISLFVDELADVVTPGIASLLAKSRGAGVRLVLAGQTLADLEASMDSEPRARQVVANCNSVIQFRAQNQDDAEVFAGLAGDRMLPMASEGESYEPAMLSSGFRDVDDFRAVFSRQRTWRPEPLVPPWAVLQLPVFHYFARWDGCVRKGVVPLLPRAGLADVEAIKDAARRDLQRGVGAGGGVGLDPSAA